MKEEDGQHHMKCMKNPKGAEQQKSKIDEAGAIGSLSPWALDTEQET